MPLCDMDGDSPSLSDIRRRQLKAELQLVDAIQLDNIEAVAEILKSDDLKRSALDSILPRVILEGRTEIAKLLIENNADVNSAAGTPLYNACHLGQNEMVSYLLSKGADINLNQGRSIFGAALEGHTSTLRILLENGPVDEYYFEEILLLAADWGHAEIVKLLLTYGTTIDEAIPRALTRAVEAGELATVNVILQHGISSQQDLDHTFVTAICYRNFEVARTLLEWGADIYSHRERYTRPEIVSDRETNSKLDIFLILSCAVLNASNGKSEMANLLSSLGVELSENLKSDAFERKDKRIAPFLRCLLYNATLAATLSYGDDDLAKHIFASIVQEDIKYVQNTKGMTYSRYASRLEIVEQEIVDFLDVVTEVADCICLPRRVLSTQAQASTMRERNTTLIDAKRDAVRMIIRGKSSRDVLALNKCWHRQGNSMPLQYRPYKKVGEWHALFEPIQLEENIHIECLTDSAKLQAEGEALYHCVGSGGYVNACQSGNIHIISIRKGDIPIATIELRSASGGLKSPDGSYWQVNQFRGSHNSDPSVEAKAAWAKFKQYWEDKKILISDQRGLTANSKRIVASNSAERICGYPLKEADKRIPQILRHYAERLVVQRGRNSWVPLIAEKELSAEPPQVLLTYFNRYNIRHLIKESPEPL